MEVGHARAESARATMLELFPEGFEEVERAGGVELAAYTDSAGEERLWAFFGGGWAADVDDDWPDRWRAFHQPVQVGDLWVGPPWEEPPAGMLAVVVDPGRAFGTGSHQTTRLCLEALQTLERTELLDVGCGSGVLAIAASLLGFAPVSGVDVEGPAIEATKLNAGVNGVAVAARVVEPDDLLGSVETAVANISLASVEALTARLEAQTLVVSGFLASEEPRLDGYVHEQRRVLDGWACDVFRSG